MATAHLDLLRKELFQKLVVEFGYEPTPPANKRYWLNRAHRKITRFLSTIGAL
jgi:hypothetical protein